MTRVSYVQFYRNYEQKQTDYQTRSQKINALVRERTELTQEKKLPVYSQEVFEVDQKLRAEKESLAALKAQLEVMQNSSTFKEIQFGNNNGLNPFDLEENAMKQERQEQNVRDIARSSIPAGISAYVGKNVIMEAGLKTFEYGGKKTGIDAAIAAAEAGYVPETFYTKIGTKVGAKIKGVFKDPYTIALEKATAPTASTSAASAAPAAPAAPANCVKSGAGNLGEAGAKKLLMASGRSWTNFGKLLKKNAITAAIAFGIETLIDGVKTYRDKGTIINKEFGLAVGRNASGAVGGALGATIGQIICPVPFLGGLVGYMVGDFVARKAFDYLTPKGSCEAIA